jgi:CoA:oxalate CoA-transferase
MARWHLGYDALTEINPHLIYAAISGFGQYGPYAHKPAYDLIIHGMGGIMSLTGLLGGVPTRVGVSIADINAGLFGVIGILSALRAREVTGRGQMVDVAMLDCQMAILENAIAQDNYLTCAVGNDKLWLKFCQAIGREELAGDQRFANNSLRTENLAALENILFAVFREKITAEWLRLLEKAGIPCGPIYTVDQMINDPQIQAREMVIEIEHPVAGKQMVSGIPVKLSDTPGGVYHPAPLLGQHTREVLQRFGFTVSEIERLEEKGVL